MPRLSELSSLHPTTGLATDDAPPDGDIDPRAVLRALGLVDVAWIGRRMGNNSAIWQVEHAGTRYALRVLRAEEEEQCRWEIVAMEAAAGVPVPRVCASGTWHDRPVLLLSWCPGRPLKQELRARPWRAWGLGVAYGRTQAAINAAPAPATLPRRGPSPAPGGPAGERVGGCAQSNRPGAAALLHFDYHPSNALTDGKNITCVLDWGGTGVGDPRADIALTLCMLRFDQVNPTSRKVVGQILYRVFEQGWRHGYGKVARWPDDKAMAPFYGWAGARIERELAHRRGPAERAPLRAWATRWAARARRDAAPGSA